MIKKHALYNKIRDGLCGMEQLFDYLRGGHLIHHATNEKNLLKILDDGKIKYNDGSFKYNYPQSKNCYSGHKKCVSLFNLTTTPIKQIIDVIDIQVSFTAQNNILICFDIKKLSKNIISNSNFKDKAVKLKKMRIGYIEDLYPTEIDIKLAKDFIVINDNKYKKYLNTGSDIKQLKNDLKKSNYASQIYL